MGYDRIAYFEGTDGETTLISADKDSSEVVYGYKFQSFLGRLGFHAQIVVDRQGVAEMARYRNRIDAEIKDLPERTKAEVIPGSRVAGWTFVEVKPPLDNEMIRVVNAYFETHCEPSDAGLILDYRQSPAECIGGY
jgi:hypothetical protein